MSWPRTLNNFIIYKNNANFCVIAAVAVILIVEVVEILATIIAIAVAAAVAVVVVALSEMTDRYKYTVGLDRVEYKSKHSLFLRHPCYFW